MSTASLLPVTLTSFAAIVPTADKAQLTWTTAQTINFKNFTVQRSADGNNFSNIATIAVANSNSSLPQSYTYTDLQATTSNVYYRLAMNDLDGTVTYSAVIHLQNANTTGIKIYPTLVENNNVYVESGKTIAHSKAIVYDMNGRVMTEQTLQNVQGRQSVNLNSSIRSGSYLVSVTDGNSQLAKQIIIVK